MVMNSKYLSFLSLLFCLISSLANVSPQEKEALCAFLNSTNIATHYPSWPCSGSPCNWNPSIIGCNEMNSSVIYILFTGFVDIEGTIPSEIGQLSQLEQLNLGGTSLSGIIPSSIGQLSQLQYLQFTRYFIGTFPINIGQLSQLAHLDFGSSTQISGTIPTSIGLLTQLTYLDAGETQLSGSIPSNIGQLSQLQYLDLSGLFLLSGILPTNIGQLSKLNYLNLNNIPIPSLPTNIGQLLELTYLDLSFTKINTIPTNIGQLSNLQYLTFTESALTGTIPTEIGHLSLVTQLYFTSTQVEGTIPTTIGQLSQIIILFLDHTLLSGQIPSSIGQLSQLQSLWLDNSNLGGTIPTSIIQLTSFTTLLASKTQISGTIPDVMGQLLTLNYLDLSSTQLSGTIPTSFAQLPQLHHLDLSQTSVCGCPHIPGTFSGSCVLSGIPPPCNCSLTTYIINTCSIPSCNDSIICATESFVPQPGPSISPTTSPSGQTPVTPTSGSPSPSVQTPSISPTSGSPSPSVQTPSISPTSGSSSPSVQTTPNPSTSGSPSPSVQTTPNPSTSSSPSPSGQTPSISPTSGSPSPSGQTPTSGSPIFPGVTPLGPSLVLVSSNNSLSVPSTTTIIVAIIVPVVVVVIIVVMVIFFVHHKRNTPVHDVELKNLGLSAYLLPWLERSNSIVWEKSSQEPVYYFSNLDISSNAYKATSDLFYNVLNGSKLKIETMFAIYNPNLLQAFNAYKLNLKNRYTNSPSLFLKNWEHSDPEINKLRAWVHNDFQKYVQKFEWNEVDDQLPIIPVVHGTDEDIGWQICNSGFAALATLDSGYYGRGIYFSTHALYTLPYFATKKNPAILICFVLPGNVFPVTESHLDVNISLMGTPLKSGFQSHYVLVRKDGKVCTEETNIYFNELVIDQEAQILPGFLIGISKSNLSEVVQQFEEIASRSLPTLNRGELE